jgi:hypothetical protein
MTRSAICTKSNTNAFTKCGSIGASEESQHIYDLYESALEALRETVCISATLEHISIAKEELADVFTEASEKNWDGNGAKAVTLETYEMASEFLICLPDFIPAPEISAEPDGAISLDWHGKNGRVLSISINEIGKLSFAAISGSREYHGTDYFNCDIPAKLINYLLEILR